MLDFLRSLWTPRPLTGEALRRQLLRRYPNHLALIDSREIPLDDRRLPDLSYLTDSPKFYYDLIVDAATHFKDKPRAVTDADREMASVAYNRFVNGTWGLIARGAESVPFALQLVRSKDSDHREAAANVFCGLRDVQRLPEVLKHIQAALRDEQEQLVIDSLLVALGQLRSRESIPALARYILDESVDGDTRFTAADSLGRVVRKRFDKSPSEAVQAACNWLTANGYEL